MRLLSMFLLLLTAGFCTGCNKEQATDSDPEMNLPDFLSDD